MKYLLTLIVTIGFCVVARGQTVCPENFTCYHLDSNNVHCYKEDSEADLDLDNDGMMDREYMYSTPGKDQNPKDKDLNQDHGVIRNRNSEIWVDSASSTKVPDKNMKEFY